MKKKNIRQYGIYLLIIYCIKSILAAQIYIPADPFNLLYVERDILSNNSNYGTLMMRPIFNSADLKNIWSIKLRSEFFLNSGAPNLENMSDRWIGKGIGHFSSVNLSFVNQYIAISAEPYYFLDQNDVFSESHRLPKFSRLNDQRPHESKPYLAYGVRELQIYAKYKGIGGGYSNANMWWGSGMHSSLMMTNNTTGFGHVFLGTLEEKRYKNIGINTRYVFSKFDKKSLYQPYFSAFVISLSYHSNNIYTIGVSKTALTGGTHPSADKVTWQEAAVAVLWSGLPGSWDGDSYRDTWSNDDHTAAGYFSVDIKKSLLKLFLEIGRNDVIASSNQFLVYPEHAMAYTIGMRKYKFFNFEQLFFGIEYTNLREPRLAHLHGDSDWYDRGAYDYSSYNGRRWVAHSGSDSDDLLITFGWLDKNFSILPSFNYERHGLHQPTSQAETNLIVDQTNNIWPETKLEFRIDLRYKYKAYRMNLYYEKEVTLNLESRDKSRRSNVIWVGIERDLSY